ncbi:hypothetical protein [uncultured Mycobacterium sp.]|uniref:hypothetical protein n=1 Tax=uncultured Mycobacterium sp. TaxID=171292 RepID=UPI0035CC6307
MSADQQRINDLRLRIKRLAGYQQMSAKQEAAYRSYLRELIELEHGSVDEFFRTVFKDY